MIVPSTSTSADCGHYHTGSGSSLNCLLDSLICLINSVLLVVRVMVRIRVTVRIRVSLLI